ncbi:hypothetical protein EBZ38_03820 [bacterium]|nr:hypothetical protein [bacterium]NDD83395.1 hypothetical protein [bacterium]
MPSLLSPIVKFGEWTPDTLDYDGGAAATVARNCLPQGDNYKPFAAFGYTTAAISGTIVGLFSCRDTSDNVHVFVGTTTRLYKLSGTTWTDVTRASGNYTMGNDGWWSFTVYGNRVIATNYLDEVQSYVIGSSTQFAALAGSPPKARGVTVVNDFVVLYGIDGYSQRVQWSALGNPTDWTSSAATQADFNDIVGEGGAVQAVVGGQNTATVIMNKQIWRMDYVGPDSIFNFTLIEDKRGTSAPRSVATDGSFVYYLSESGFMAFNGSTSVGIGHNKVDRYFAQRVDLGYRYSKTIGFVDPVNKCVMWAYPYNNGNQITHLIAYSWQDNRWTEIESSCAIVGQGLTVGYTVEDIGAIYPTLEEVPFSFDSPVWQGGQYVLCGVDATGRFGFYTAGNMTAVIATKEAQLNQGGLAAVQSVIPVTDSDTVTIRVGSRMLQSASINYTASQMPHASTGEANFRAVARYHRAEVTVSGTWRVAQGVQFRYTAQGVR